MLYKTNDIIAMTIVYEGHLPQGHTLDNNELAHEIITVGQQSGLPVKFKLSHHTVIKAKRVDESAYYTENYKPTDDFPAMLKECFKEVSGKIIESGETPGPMPMKSLQFKSKSRIASTVWVDIHIKQ